MAVRSILGERGGDGTLLHRGDLDFDVIVGILLLKTDVWELKWVSRLPDILERLGLLRACIALLYALGHEEELRDPAERGASEEGELHFTALKWRDQPASEDLPEKPSFYEGRTVTLQSNLLGCNVTVDSENASPCVELAESVLAALESLLSTGTVQWMRSGEPSLTIAVRKSDFAERPFEFGLQDYAGRPHLSITCFPFDPHSMSIDAQQEMKERLFELLANIMARIVTAKDLPQTLEKLVREDLALDRSLSFTGTFVSLGNVLGYHPKNQISEWFDPQAKEYPPKRPEAWDAGDRRAEKETRQDSGRPKLTWGAGEPPEEVTDRGSAKHTQIQTISLIRDTLWDKAEWTATAYFTSAEDSSSLPILGPVIKNSEPASQIFSQWRTELGFATKRSGFELPLSVA
jgi:hypothetical protein